MVYCYIDERLQFESREISHFQGSKSINFGLISFSVVLTGTDKFCGEKTRTAKKGSFYLCPQ